MIPGTKNRIQERGQDDRSVVVPKQLERIRNDREALQNDGGQSTHVGHERHAEWQWRRTEYITKRNADGTDSSIGSGCEADSFCENSVAGEKRVSDGVAGRDVVTEPRTKVAEDRCRLRGGGGGERQRPDHRNDGESWQAASHT